MNREAITPLAKGRSLNPGIWISWFRVPGISNLHQISCRGARPCALFCHSEKPCDEEPLFSFGKFAQFVQFVFQEKLIFFPSFLPPCPPFLRRQESGIHVSNATAKKDTGNIVAPQRRRERGEGGKTFSVARFARKCRNTNATNVFKSHK